MTLRDLTSSATLMGNISINVWENGKEVGHRFFENVDDFDCYHYDCDDIADYEITFISSEHELCVTSLVIDVSKD